MAALDTSWIRLARARLRTARRILRSPGEKTFAAVLPPMGIIRETIADTREDRKRLRHVPSFAPSGQSIQLMVKASPESDFEVLALADRLYRQQSLCNAVTIGGVDSSMVSFANHKRHYPRSCPTAQRRSIAQWQHPTIGVGIRNQSACHRWVARRRRDPPRRVLNPSCFPSTNTTETSCSGIEIC